MRGKDDHLQQDRRTGESGQGGARIDLVQLLLGLPGKRKEKDTAIAIRRFYFYIIFCPPKIHSLLSFFLRFVSFGPVLSVCKHKKAHTGKTTPMRMMIMVMMMLQPLLFHCFYLYSFFPVLLTRSRLTPGAV